MRDVCLQLGLATLLAVMVGAMIECATPEAPRGAAVELQ